MQKKTAIDALVAALDRSLRQLDFFMALGHGALVRPILLRRRRALLTLRTILRWGGHPAQPVALQPDDPAPLSLHSLWQTERGLVALYDAALAQTPAHTIENGLLVAQRAEAEQAFLTISAALTDRGPARQPAVQWSFG